MNRSICLVLSEQTMGRKCTGDVRVRALSLAGRVLVARATPRSGWRGRVQCGRLLPNRELRHPATSDTKRVVLSGNEDLLDVETPPDGVLFPAHSLLATVTQRGRAATTRKILAVIDKADR